MHYSYNEDEAIYLRAQLAKRIELERNAERKESMLHLKECMGTEGPIETELANRPDWPEIINTIMYGPEAGDTYEPGIL